MLESIPLPLFVEWVEFNALQPYTPERDDLRFAMLCAFIGNMFRGKKGRPLKPEDFMPKFGRRERRRQTPEEMKAILNMAKAAADQAAQSKRRR